MNVKTKDGIDIYCLPECAICQLSDENPLDMEVCPRCQEYCTPDICNEYMEAYSVEAESEAEE